MTEPAQPSIFISHRHTDREVADGLRTFIQDASSGEVEVYQSSHFENAPKAGHKLHGELRRQLYTAGRVMCIFTSEEGDWSYCMWECGVATDPLAEADSKVVVFQFTDAFPPPFNDQVRVDVRDPESVHKFVKDFLTDPNFFPGAGKAVSPKLSDEQISRKALELAGGLEAFTEIQVDEWPAWLYLTLQLSEEDVQQINDAPSEGRVVLTREMLHTTCSVVGGDKTARNLFGYAKFPLAKPFGDVIAAWQADHPADAGKWVDSLANQMCEAAQERFPKPVWEVVEGAVGDQSWAIPIINWVRTTPGVGTKFEVIFLPVRKDDRDLPLIGTPDREAAGEP